MCIFIISIAYTRNYAIWALYKFYHFAHFPTIGNGMRNIEIQGMRHIEIQRQNSRIQVAKSDAFYRMQRDNLMRRDWESPGKSPTWRHGGCSNMNASNVFFVNISKSKILWKPWVSNIFHLLEKPGRCWNNSAIIVSDVSLCPLFWGFAKLPSCLVQLHCLVFASSTVNFLFLQEPMFMKYSLWWL